MDLVGFVCCAVLCMLVLVYLPGKRTISVDGQAIAVLRIPLYARSCLFVLAKIEIRGCTGRLLSPFGIFRFSLGTKELLKELS